MDGYGNEAGNYTLLVTEAFPYTGGDTCETAVEIICLPASADGSTIGAQHDYAATCPQTDTAPDVVYSFRPPFDMKVDITLCAGITNYDTKLVVYEESCDGPPFACSDDDCSAPQLPDYVVSELENLPLLSDYTYYIVVDGADSAAGEYTIFLDGGGPLEGGETCADATAIDHLPYTGVGTTMCKSNDYSVECPWSDISPDVVYALTPPADMLIDITLCAGLTNFNTKLIVFEDTCAAAHYACSDDDCFSPDFGTSQVSQLVALPVAAEHTYYIVVDGSLADVGEYTLEVYETPPAPDCPPAATFTQPPQARTDNWDMHLASDFDAGKQRFESFAIDGPIGSVRWWGFDGHLPPYGSWGQCDEQPESYVITFHEDNNGMPGSEVYSYSVVPDRYATGLCYVFELQEYYTTLSPPCSLDSGWISIRGPGGDACCFLWLPARTGDYSSYLHIIGGPMLEISLDLSVCLTSINPGDLDCDGNVDFDDIDPFVLALTGQAPYEAEYPDCQWLNADCNNDSGVDFDDIDAFVALLAEY